ncbi:MAG: hypothetical protein KF832_27365 [Caldilineaceae bacterium]|nr:hypothetical protein [Caldilineaceae bacterium]
MNVEAELKTLAAKHGFSVDAVRQLYGAIQAGNGAAAQFSHAEFGGMGQWMRGGMLMIGDMFNHSLKGRVDALCHDLSALYWAAPAATTATAAVGWGRTAASWWPAELGMPASSGGQNALEYAYFPQVNRVAVRQAKQVTLYDSTGHQIGGFSQQQGARQDLYFTSQRGMFPIASLPVVA